MTGLLRFKSKVFQFSLFWSASRLVFPFELKAATKLLYKQITTAF